MSDTRYLDWPFFETAPCRRCSASWTPGPRRTSRSEAACRRRRPVPRSGARRWAKPAGCATAVAGSAYGGAGEALDTRALCLMRETLARHSGLADFAFAMQGLGSGAISLHGTPAQKDRYLPRWRAATGDRRLRTVRARGRLRRGRDELRSAHRRRRGGARTAEDLDLKRRHRRLLRASSRAAAKPRARAASRAFIVDAGTPGFDDRRAHRRHRAAPAGAAGVPRLPRAARAQRIGEGGEGFKIAMRTLDVFRTSVAAAALGMARRALDEALRTRHHAPHVRAAAGRLPAHAGQAGEDGDHHRQRGAAHLPRRLDARPGPATSRAKRRWPR